LLLDLTFCGNCVCVKLCVGLGLLWVEMGDLEGCVVSGLE
jgi:hypothetical protein